jgi:FMN phosphatase YigB (HAD superfamily)
MNNSKAIIFDLDGTLIPINDKLVEQVRLSLANTISREFNIGLEKALIELEKIIEDTFEDDPYLKYRKAALQFMSPKEATEGFYKLKEDPPEFDEKIYQTIKKLKENNFIITVVSNSSKKRIEQRLRDLKIFDFVDFLASSRDFLSGKNQFPKFEVFQNILQKFNLEPKNVYVIGDSYNLDLAPANLLGLNTILVLHNRSVVNWVIKREEFSDLINILIS